MKIPFCCLVAVLLLLAIPTINLATVFPTDGLPEGWNIKGQARVFTRNGLYGHINGGSELFLEFGFHVLHVQKYQDKTESDEITIEAYKMTSPEAALGIYLMKCGDESPVPGIDKQARNTGDRLQLMLLKGIYFVTVNNFSGKSSLMPVMVQLSNLFLEKIPVVKPADLISLLPKENRVSGTEMLFRGPYSLEAIYTLGDGDILLLENKIFGVTAQYFYKRNHATVNKQETFNRLMVRYPEKISSQKAYSHLKTHLDSYIQVLNESENHLTFKDFRGKFGVISLKEDIIYIEVNLPAIK
jgi:hypothetical protein